MTAQKVCVCGHDEKFHVYEVDGRPVCIFEHCKCLAFMPRIVYGNLHTSNTFNTHSQDGSIRKDEHTRSNNLLVHHPDTHSPEANLHALDKQPSDGIDGQGFGTVKSVMGSEWSEPSEAAQIPVARVLEILEKVSMYKSEINDLINIGRQNAINDIENEIERAIKDEVKG